MCKQSPPPTFDGNRRKWSEFRNVWLRCADSEFSDDASRPYALKLAIGGKVAAYIRPVFCNRPGAYQVMWQRLDRVYFDISLCIQSALTDLSKLEPVKAGDFFAPVHFVNEGETIYSQLGEVEQNDAITLNQVASLSDLFPLELHRGWLKIYRVLSQLEQLLTFNPFMLFLEEERDVVREGRGKTIDEL